MCGLGGFLDSRIAPGGAAVLEAMADRLFHRGPDDRGIWQDEAAGIGLAHCRLSIVDLSAAGAQPMASPGGRYVIAYNGEVYNHQALRRSLDELGRAPQWRGHSDTETLLAAFEAWGVEVTLEAAVGMFAFALWDREARILTLARDRLGEKPLYYGWSDGVFLFSSELKTLTAHPRFQTDIDREAVSFLLRRQFIGGPRSIYRDIRKLPPGTILTVSLDRREPRIVPYWSVAKGAQAGLANRFSGSDSEAIDRLEALLTDAIGLQMVADVPVGAFLSGGVDSSAIVALMQRQSARPVRTFTIGFAEDAFNEAPFAAEVARHLGTDHTELYVTPVVALDVIPKLPALYDEPFADVSQIPTFLVSKLARTQVTVSLSGDAGDELFGGYNTYGLAERFFRLNSALPLPLRQALGGTLAAVAPVAGLVGRGNLARRFGLAADVIAAPTASATVERLLGHWAGQRVPVIGLPRMAEGPADDGFEALAITDLERMMLRDMAGYLPDDILAKVDRASMGVSLESRVPLLDHRIVEFALSLPMSLRRRGTTGKWILREVLYRHVPRALIDRPKKGFGVPLAAWLRGPLRDWASDLLAPNRLKRDGLLDPAPILRAWDDHCSGRRDRHNDLWSVLMLQQWLSNK